MVMKITNKQYRENQIISQKNLEAEQLLGYWSKMQGFSRKTLEKANIETLQAVTLATNIIKNSPRQQATIYTECNNFLRRFHKGNTLSDKEVKQIYKHARTIQRQQAKKARKATR